MFVQLKKQKKKTRKKNKKDEDKEAEASARSEAHMSCDTMCGMWQRVSLVSLDLQRTRPGQDKQAGQAGQTDRQADGQTGAHLMINNACGQFNMPRYYPKH